MKTVMFVGGATACGKTTFAKAINERMPNSIMYRRYQGFFDIAESEGISYEKIFSEVSPYDVDDFFVEKCLDSEMVISDVHYAIQMNRSNSKPDIYKEYVPTISSDLINKLLSNNIKIVAVYLNCSPEECYKRSIIRFSRNEKDMRNISVDDAILENIAEKREWNNISSVDTVDGIILNSEFLTTDQLVDELSEYFEKSRSETFTRKKLYK